MRIILATPRGFCAGVDRAVAIVDRALELFPAPIYVRHEVVHNRHVVEEFKQRGVVFIDRLSEVPDGSIVIFSAHGVSPDVHKSAQLRKLRVFDATCPLVTKVHLEVARHAAASRDCVLIGHATHPEVIGTVGYYQTDCGSAIHIIDSVAAVEKLDIEDPDHIAFVTQTTLSVDDTAIIIAALKERFPKIVGPRSNDICYATQNRQDAIKELAKECDLILVVGSKNSSNSNRLREIASQYEVAAYLIDSVANLDENWLTGRTTIGITAGASAPEVLVEELCTQLATRFEVPVEIQAGQREEVIFPLPEELRQD